MDNEPSDILQSQAALKEKTDLERRILKQKALIKSISGQASESTRRVTRNNRDKAAIKELSSLEKKWDKEKKTLQELEKRKKELNKFIKSLSIKMENSKVDELNKKLAKLRKRRKEINSELIPEQEFILTELKEEFRQIEDKIENLNHEIHKVQTP